MPLRLPKIRWRKSRESLNESPRGTLDSSAMSVSSMDSWTQSCKPLHPLVSHILPHTAVLETGGYIVPKLKELSKLHKAVWKEDLNKVKEAIASLKKSMYIDYFDKEQRYSSSLGF